MSRKLLLLGIAVLLVLGLLSGCSQTSNTSGPTTLTGNYKIVRKATLGANWQMYQFELTLPSNGNFDIDFVGLAQGDKVDGFFYTENGSGVSAGITAGTNSLYSSSTSSSGNNSDRFSFSAGQPEGTAYALLFKNAGTDNEITVFVEVIYPVTASIRGPLR